MKASQLIKLSGNNWDVSPRDDFDIAGISLDSRSIKERYCFVAMKGYQVDGYDYIPRAIEQGAKLVLCEQECNHLAIKYPEVVFAKANDIRNVLGEIAKVFFNNSVGDLRIIGITGTNGKTTVSFFIEQMLRSKNIICGLVGTIYYKTSKEMITATNTTPDVITLNKLFSNMLEAKATHAVIEVSSHAIDQQRIAGIFFSGAVFTNLTQDHLDYHHDMDQYFSTKAKLFQNLTKDNYAVINTDDEYGKKLLSLTSARIVSYGINDSKALVQAKNLILKNDGSSFSLKTPWGQIFIESKFIGKHNVYNVLAAAAVGLEEGMELEEIKQSIENMNAVPGRLEKVDSNSPFDVIVDYAHTDDALANVLIALKEICRKNIILVFGCGGDRDRTKRPLMGKVASELADYVIFTSDNSRGEDPQQIIEDITKGLSNDFSLYQVIPDRKQAIECALSKAQAGDIVLIAGKGHETYQIFKDKTIDFDDRQMVREVLKLKNN